MLIKTYTKVLLLVKNTHSKKTELSYFTKEITTQKWKYKILISTNLNNLQDFPISKLEIFAGDSYLFMLLLLLYYYCCCYC